MLGGRSWRKTEAQGFRPIYLLLLIPYVAMLWVPSYNRIEPEIAGIPFFYWYQMLWIVLGAAVLIPVYFAKSAARRSRMMMDHVAVTIFVALFAFVTVLGFVAARWRRGDLNQLHEWGLGGRRFGTVVTWFLLGGDLYTAYTFIAVPALMFGAGAIGFFAVPYTILVYPLMFAVFPRLWSVAQAKGYVTAADFVRGRFGNRTLALAVAVTGIVATMPYIALQLVGMEVVIAGLGIHHGRRDSGHRHGARPAAADRLRGAGALHLYQRPARAGADRGGQGCPALHHGDRGGDRHSGRARRLRARSSPRADPKTLLLPPATAGKSWAAVGLCDAGAGFGAWRCFSIRMR